MVASGAVAVVQAHVRWCYEDREHDKASLSHSPRSPLQLPLSAAVGAGPASAPLRCLSIIDTLPLRTTLLLTIASGVTPARGGPGDAL